MYTKLILLNPISNPIKNPTGKIVRIHERKTINYVLGDAKAIFARCAQGSFVKRDRLAP